MEFVGQAVPDGDAGILRKRVDVLLPEAAVLDPVEHAAEDAGGVRDALFLADLRARGVEIGHAHAEIVARHLEGAAGAGAGLLEDQGDVLPLAEPVRDAGLFLRLEIGCEIQKPGDLRRRKV